MKAELTSDAGKCSLAVSPHCRPQTKYRLDGKPVCTYCLMHQLIEGELVVTAKGVTPAAVSVPDIEVAWE